MSDAVTPEDLAALARITEHHRILIKNITDSRIDLVEYALALACAARSVHKTIQRFDPVKPGDLARYEHLGKILQSLSDRDP